MVSSDVPFNPQNLQKKLFHVFYSIQKKNMNLVGLDFPDQKNRT